MDRILEPELMDDKYQAMVYAQADFAASNQAFVDRLVADYGPALRHAVDFGCGPADVVIRLAAAKPDIRITAVDGSAAMITLARTAVTAAGREHNIRLIEGYIPGTPPGEHIYDAVLSKDFLHHLLDPMMLWYEAKRVGKPGAVVFVMDLIRPATQADARAIVEQVAGQADAVLKQDFYNSLCAAFTPAEVEQQLRTAGLACRVQTISERHMLIQGRL